MSGQASWECEGRQEHGWFGDGTCADDGGSDDRLLRVVHGTIGHLPTALRARWEAMLSRGPKGRMIAVLRRLGEASGLDADRFRALLPDTTGEAAAGKVQEAARAVAAARTVDNEGAASAALAGAVQAVGLDNWSRLVAGVEDKFADPVNQQAASLSVTSPDIGKDAIRPVYPVEALVGIGAAGVAGGVAAAARAAGAALVRQLVPKPSASIRPASQPKTLTVVPPKPSIVFGTNPNATQHAFRHIERIGLSRGQVAAAIRADLAPRLPLARSANNAPFRGSVSVNGVQLNYHAYSLQDGTINVGRITY